MEYLLEVVEEAGGLPWPAAEGAEGVEEEAYCWMSSECIGLRTDVGKLYCCRGRIRRLKL